MAEYLYGKFVPKILESKVSLVLDWDNFKNTIIFGKQNFLVLD